MFDHLIISLNKCLHTSNSSNLFVGLLDIYGFENFDKNRWAFFFAEFSEPSPVPPTPWELSRDSSRHLRLPCSYFQTPAISPLPCYFPTFFPGIFPQYFPALFSRAIFPRRSDIFRYFRLFSPIFRPFFRPLPTIL
jgi:hypothetical protein